MVTWSRYEELAHHLVVAHRYEDDPYGEDTAQTNAWRAYYEAGFNPPQY